MTKLNYFLAFLISILCIDLQATHIVGGDVSYEFLRFNSDTTQATYKITYNMYRDTYGGGAPFDNDLEFGVFRKAIGGVWEVYSTEGPLNHGPIIDIPYDHPCNSVPTNVGVEATKYVFEVQLDIGGADYMIVYQRCCRNDFISNVSDSGDKGAAYTVTISQNALRQGNSSPIFNQYPPLFVCVGEPLSVDASGNETEGDSLRYSFCAPFVAGGPGGNDCVSAVIPDPTCPPPFGLIEFKEPYNSNEPLIGDPIVTIDALTGMITGTPTSQGRYIVGLCIEEYDQQGKFLSRINRDMEFNVIACQNKLTSLVKVDEVAVSGCSAESENVIRAYVDKTVSFENLSEGTEIINSRWQFMDALGNTILDQTITNIETLEFEFPDYGVYTGSLTVNEGLECPNIACFTVELYANTSLDEISNDKITNVFPNPFLQEINIDYDTDEPLRACITDALGRKVVEQELPPNQSTLAVDLSHLSDGVYFFSVLDERNRLIHTKSMVKL